jgi:hypothetical protein
VTETAHVECESVQATEETAVLQARLRPDYTAIISPTRRNRVTPHLNGFRYETRPRARVHFRDSRMWRGRSTHFTHACIEPPVHAIWNR